MKLYDLSFSPYSSRVRIVIRAKGLPVEVCPPPVALRTEDFKTRFPMGKIPLLELDDGTCLPESWVIMEYLEDIYPQSPLRPSDSLACAQMRVLNRLADVHLGPALFPLFGLLMQADPDKQKIAAQLQAVEQELRKTARVLDDMLPLDARPMNLGDISLVTTVYFVDAILPLFGSAMPLQPHAPLLKWWHAMRDVSAVRLTLDEIDVGFQAFLKQIGRLSA